MSEEKVISTPSSTEFADSYISSLEQDIAELQHLHTQAQRPAVKNVLDTQIKLFKTKIEDEKKKAQQVNEEKEKKQLQDSQPSKPILHYESISSYSWDENDDFVSIYLSLEGNKGAIHSHYTDRGFAIAIHDYNGKNLKLTINNLYKDLDKAGCKEIKREKTVTIKLKKKQSGKWLKLIATKDDMKKEDSADTSDPSAGLMTMMKKLYDEGDEEMKKLIAKTWTESQDKSKKGEPKFTP